VHPELFSKWIMLDDVVDHSYKHLTKILTVPEAEDVVVPESGDGAHLGLKVLELVGVASS
jgi:hypothetical protein